jgi:transcriptional regulator GlxA family with amidase domain
VIVQKNTKTCLAANAAGYEDPTRLGREFRRRCRLNPAEMMREVTVA